MSINNRKVFIGDNSIDNIKIAMRNKVWEKVAVNIRSKASTLFIENMRNQIKEQLESEINK